MSCFAPPPASQVSTQLQSVSSRAKEAEQRLSATSEALEKARAEREKLVKEATSAITRVTDLRQELNSTKLVATKRDEELARARKREQELAARAAEAGAKLQEAKGELGKTAEALKAEAARASSLGEERALALRNANELKAQLEATRKQVGIRGRHAPCDDACRRVLLGGREGPGCGWR